MLDAHKLFFYTTVSYALILRIKNKEVKKEFRKKQFDLKK